MSFVKVDVEKQIEEKGKMILNLERRGTEGKLKKI